MSEAYLSEYEKIFLLHGVQVSRVFCWFCSFVCSDLIDLFTTTTKQQQRMSYVWTVVLSTTIDP